MIQERKKQIIDQILRVDHAGEYGAFYIYEGQLWAFKNKPEIFHTIEEMKAHEAEHLNYFSKQLPLYKARPSLFLPLWKIAGFTLGAVSGLLGSKTAMACTVAVEEVIEQHYQEQLDLMKELGEQTADIYLNIEKFRLEEIEHKNIGLASEAENLLSYNLISNVIKAGCKLAIFLSKRI